MRYFVHSTGLILTAVFSGLSLHAQNAHHITATLKAEAHTINIQQEIIFHNQTNDTLNTLYLLDWNNAYAGKNTALAKRFAEEFNKSLHLAKAKERGFTKIISVADKNFNALKWKRLRAGDIVKIQLNFPVYPNQKFSVKLYYTVTLPESKFTSYGHTPEGDFNLRYWYITPALYNQKGWQLDSNKNLDDLPAVPTHYNITFNYPETYTLTTELDIDAEQHIPGYKQTVLSGNHRADVKLFLEQTPSFDRYPTEHFMLITNIESNKLSREEKMQSVQRVIDFIVENTGAYPHRKLLAGEIDYRKNPLYGLNQLPSFLSPFSESFQYEMKLLKTLLNNYLEHTLYIDVRRERWVTDAIQTYIMIRYKDTFYPDMKLLGSLSNVWLVRTFHLAKMDFNEQYSFLYMLMARKNIDQSLSTATDDLIKFNEKIANKYKAGLGLDYLDDYTGGNIIDNAIKQFYNTYALKKTSAGDFETLLKSLTTKNIDWFFEEYIPTRHKIDFKIKEVEETAGDSLLVTIKNKRDINVPISLFGIRNDSVVSGQWLTGIETEKPFTIPKNNAEQLVLNYNKVIPEFNQRNNWKSVEKGFIFNKPIQFRFFKDAEDPFYNQVFYVPIFSYNLYDGITLGLRLYNKSLIERPFLYDIHPFYATREKTWVGSAGVAYRQYLEGDNLYIINYGLRGASFHYAENLRYSTITPSLTFGFRTPDLRANEKRFITLRNVNVFRDKTPEIDTDPDYSVFNARYNYIDNHILNYKAWFADFQLSKNFSKFVFSAEYRKLFQSNRQLNLRLFAGKFIHNDTNSDFFSFALDRPTDYLFNYDYLGRSEDSGFYSQQIIIAEGGFKSKLTPAFANDWMLAGNASINLWRWIEVYGDAGLVKNKGMETRFVYDAGLRLNLVTDYFELYLPFYSNNGWEIAQSSYSEKIRFIVTLSPKTLIGLFTRKWF